MTFYVVATPIGNLEDITLRALRILNEVDAVLCEDTRVTKKLFQRYDIHTPLISYHAHSTKSKVGKIAALIKEGKTLALVSDAGTPTISDPGVTLVAHIRDTFGDMVTIVPIPGPSALITALSVSGLSSSDFLFLGFLPRKKGRVRTLEEIAASRRTVVFYESPHRVERTLSILAELFVGERKVVLARELTKIYEEMVSGDILYVLKHLRKYPEKLKGEFVVMVEGVKK